MCAPHNPFVDANPKASTFCMPDQTQTFPAQTPKQQSEAGSVIGPTTDGWQNSTTEHFALFHLCL